MIFDQAIRKPSETSFACSLYSIGSDESRVLFLDKPKWELHREVKQSAVPSSAAINSAPTAASTSALTIEPEPGFGRQSLTYAHQEPFLLFPAPLFRSGSIVMVRSVTLPRPSGSEQSRSVALWLSSGRAESLLPRRQNRDLALRSSSSGSHFATP